MTCIYSSFCSASLCILSVFILSVWDHSKNFSNAEKYSLHKTYSSLTLKKQIFDIQTLSYFFGRVNCIFKNGFWQAIDMIKFRREIIVGLILIYFFSKIWDLRNALNVFLSWKNHSPFWKQNITKSCW